MATGVIKSEFNQAIIAKLAHKEPYPEIFNSDVKLQYKNRLEQTEILKPIHTNFISVFDNDEDVCIQASDLVLGDNIFALHTLMQQKTTVDLIYLDPPYNTGLEFKTRNQEHAYSDKFSLASYLENMRIKFILMKEILSENGSIYVHIGHQMMPYLKIIMDEVFGIENCRNIITRKKCSSKNSTVHQFSNLNDFVLFYTKTSNYIWNQQGENPTEDWIKKEYPKKDEKGLYKLVPIHAPGTRNGETGKEWRGRLPPKGKHWQYTPEKLDIFDANGEIHWSKNNNPRRKVYLTSDKLLPYSDYWENFRDAHHQSIQITGYPTEKNLDMLKMIILSSSNENSLVLDPFCGSGTTLQASDETGRRWIGIDQSITALKYSINRIKSGTQAMGDYVSLPTQELKPNFQKPEKLRLVIDKDVYAEFKSDILNNL